MTTQGQILARGRCGRAAGKYAEEQITDEGFRRERTLPNGWTLNTKEEMMYSWIFEKRFGRLGDLSWMERTKGAPRRGETV